MVEIRPLRLPDVREIKPARHGDDRGFFSEVYNRRSMSDKGLDIEFVQDNHSHSREVGVLRGLHFQMPPFAQDKLIRVTKGRIFDVAVDIRKGSATYGQWVGLDVSAEAWNQIFVPKGFAHGFVTLEPDTEVLYKVTSLYSPEHDRGIRFNDPDIGIDWPVDEADLTLSPKDRDAPFLHESETGF
ncbi:dTDP-4-dehydrorhamnose 3,5-epimerase [Hoeflea sp. CAU 1731]